MQCIGCVMADLSSVLMGSCPFRAIPPLHHPRILDSCGVTRRSCSLQRAWTMKPSMAARNLLTRAHEQIDIPVTPVW